MDSIKENNINIFFTNDNKKENDDRITNDVNNKLREQIIVAIINKKIPKNYYENNKWKQKKEEIAKYITEFCKRQNINNYNLNDIKCIIKATRKNPYDFTLIINNNEYKIEFKFNTKNIIGTPQFSSPCKPSNFLDINFEEYFYDNWLPQIVSKYNQLNNTSIQIPSKVEYIKTINNNKVNCMKPFKDFYKNKQFNKFCKDIDKKAIKKFIQLSKLDINKLSVYLANSQKDKIYMCYKDGRFYYDENNKNLLNIKKVINKTKTNYICETKNGMKLNVKLRFKNGCGLQFPAFQISRKIPLIKDLKNICKKNNLNPPKLKNDICKLLDKNNIIY
jgi:hypothetical protein